jgi:hypothetical protein
MKESTRFKLAIGILAVYFVQGLIKAFLPEFPLIEVIAAEGAVVGYYFTVRTIQDVKQLDCECKNGTAK